MKSVISLSHVTKFYGSVRGVEDVSLSVEKGKVFGFLGPNGAGKSTTINMMVNLIHPTKGNITIFGLDSDKDSLAIRRRIGFLAGDFALDGGLTGWQQLEYFGNLRGNFDKKYIRELAARLDFKLNRKFKTLSRGNKQKLGLISALMHKPELLILDEPTSGLDPLIQAEFNRIVLDYKRAGKTVFISSHILSEIQELCDEVAFIREGRVVTSKPLAEIVRGLPKQVRVMGASRSLQQNLKRLPGTKAEKTNDGMMSFTYSGEVNELLQLLSKAKITDLTIHDPDLETIFMQYYEGK